MANLILTPEWTEEIYQLETSDLIIGGPDGIDNRQAIQLGKRTEWLKEEVEKRAPSLSPKFTGIPTAPTASVGTKNQQLATTQFVANAIAALVGSAPATLDTLAEIATALGGDGNLKATLLAEIGNKANNTDFISLKNLLVGIPFPYPLTAVPSGCLAFNGQAFNQSTYPELAKKYPSGRLPDLRGEFIRGWDNGRGVDSGRGILTSQSDSFKSHYHYLMTTAGGDGGIVKYGLFKDVSTDTYSSISITSQNHNSVIADGFPLQTYPDGLNETRPRNIAFQYICLAK